MVKGRLTEVHIADIHFGAFDPATQYKILQEQFLNRIVQLSKIDAIVIDGDLFDHKVMSNSDTTMYASLFVNDLVNITRMKSATLVILHGTYSHDYDQLKIFYHYLEDTFVDIRIITSIQFITIKNARILCIPELYGIDENIYDKVFNHSGWYDEAFVHGTFKGSVYGDNVGRGRLLTPEDFKYCTGVAVAGHVHKGGCFNGFFYYCGCPYRWKFGEEEDKGYIILIHDLDTRYHYVDFEKIESFRYDTIYLDELVSNDPRKTIMYISNIKSEKNIDYIKVKFRVPVDLSDQTIIKNHYRNNGSVFVEFLDRNDIKNKEKLDQITSDKYSYLLDNKISDLEKFVMYINESQGAEFITIDALKKILSENI